MFYQDIKLIHVTFYQCFDRLLGSWIINEPLKLWILLLWRHLFMTVSFYFIWYKFHVRTAVLFYLKFTFASHKHDHKNLLSCLSKGYVSTYVCKGGTLPNTKAQQQQNKQSFYIYFQHRWHKTRSALPKKDQVKLASSPGTAVVFQQVSTKWTHLNEASLNTRIVCVTRRICLQRSLAVD